MIKALGLCIGDGGGLVGKRVGLEMISDFPSFSIVFQSYQYCGWLIMAGCVRWKSK